MKLSTRVLTAAIVAALIAVFALGGSSAAQAQAGTPTATQAATPAATNEEKAAIGAIVARAVLTATIDVTGISGKDLLRDLFNGQTLTAIITAKGGDVAAVKAAATTTLTIDVAAAVTNGKLTQAQADKLNATLDTLLSAALNGTFDAQFKAKARQLASGAVRLAAKMQAALTLLAATADATGVSQRDMLKDLRAGKSFADIARANNADPAAIVNTAAAKLTAYVNARVKNGKIKQEVADQVLATLNADLTALMNKPNPLANEMAGDKTPKPRKTPGTSATPSL